MLFDRFRETARRVSVRPIRAHAACAGLLLALTLAADPAAAQTVRTGSGANPAAIQAIVDQFRADLGGGAVAGPNGAFGGQRREINWDGVPDAFATPAALPNDFFNTTSPRGVVFTPDDVLPGAPGFTVSMDDDTPADADPDDVLFGNLKPVYPAQFQTFSAERLFAVTDAYRMDVRFYLPGTTTPAVVRGFGAVFTGVDVGFSSSISYYDADGQPLGTYRAATGALSFVGVSFPDARIARVIITPGNTPIGNVNEFPNVIDVVAMDDFIYGEPTLRRYILSEGATSSFFDTDILLANPRATDTEAQITFIKPDGTTVPLTRQVPAMSRVTIPLKSVPGIEATEVSTVVIPQDGLPLGVERTVFWDAGRYGGHTGEAVQAAATRWLFAEGVQGFFDTFFLLTNQNAAPTTVTFTFLLEDGTPIVKAREIGPHARLSVAAAEFPELSGRAFGIIVDAPLAIVAERAVYFGSVPGQLWTGGHESAGVPEPAKEWFFSEGAMGGFFDTFLLLMNPGDTDAVVDLKYLPQDGPPITVQKPLASKQRLTIKLEDEDPALAFGAAGTQISSDEAIVAERSMYWVGADAQPWTEAHNSFGVTRAVRRWLLAEGRLGGPLNYRTYVLLAYPFMGTAEVALTFLRESGEPIVKHVTIDANSRKTFDVGAEAPELAGESFGVLIESTNGAQITVERSMYWDAKNVFWGGGTNAAAAPLSSFVP